MNSRTSDFATVTAAQPLTLLAAIELRRESPPHSSAHCHPVRVIEHVTALVFDGGLIVSAVVGRSLHLDGRTLCTHGEDRVVSLSASERADVLSAAGLSPCPPVARQEVAPC